MQRKIRVGMGYDGYFDGFLSFELYMYNIHASAIVEMTLRVDDSCVNINIFQKEKQIS